MIFQNSGKMPTMQRRPPLDRVWKFYVTSNATSEAILLQACLQTNCLFVYSFLKRFCLHLFNLPMNLAYLACCYFAQRHCILSPAAIIVPLNYLSSHHLFTASSSGLVASIYYYCCCNDWLRRQLYQRTWLAGSSYYSD